VLTLLAASAGPARGGTINFDVNAESNTLTAPRLFSNATHLSEIYASWGVHFAGPAGNDGGAILVDISTNNGGWGGWARSSPNVLAFTAPSSPRDLSDGGHASGPETIRFDSAMKTVTLWATGDNANTTFELAAFDGNGIALDSDTESITVRNWVSLSVSSDAGIRSVVFTLKATDNPWTGYLVDDLSYTPDLLHASPRTRDVHVAGPCDNGVAGAATGEQA